MECDKCHDLLSDLLDDTLDGDDRRLLDSHLEECLSCTGAHTDINRIIALARENREQLHAPPDGCALWMRIRENVENDIEWAREAKIEREAARAAVGVASSAHESWWSRFWNARWEFSAAQVTGAFATLAVAAALGVSFGTSRLGTPTDEAQATGGQQFAGTSAAQPVALEDYVRRQQADIDYWRQRVEENKSRLPPRVRDSFERTMVRLDEDVNLSLDQLRRNPHDDVSEQMLNRALQDKAEILKELSSEF